MLKIERITMILEAGKKKKISESWLRIYYISPTFDEVLHQKFLIAFDFYNFGGEFF